MAGRGKRGRSRANGEGSISKRKDGRYDVELPVHTPEGTKRLRTTKKTKVEADRWLTETKYERNSGTTLAFDADRLTFGEYLQRWLVDVVKGSVARHTYKDYEGKVRLHLVPALGKVKLKDLTAAHLQFLYRSKSEEGLSPRTVGYIHTAEPARRWEEGKLEAAVEEAGFGLLLSYRRGDFLYVQAVKRGL